MEDKQFNQHYVEMEIEPIEVIRIWAKKWGAASYALANIVKYAARFYTKNTPEYQLQGIRFYCDELQKILDDKKHKEIQTLRKIFGSMPCGKCEQPICYCMDDIRLKSLGFVPRGEQWKT